MKRGMMDLLSIKDRALKKAMELVNDKIQDIQKELSELQKSSESDTKSSMGDKYETAREMIQLERNKLGEQFDQFSSQLRVLTSIKSEDHHPCGKMGALIDTDNGMFLLSVGLGKVEVPETVILLSPGSPMGKMMMGAKKADKFGFGPNTYLVREIG